MFVKFATVIFISFIIFRRSYTQKCYSCTNCKREDRVKCKNDLARDTNLFLRYILKRLKVDSPDINDGTNSDIQCITLNSNLTEFDEYHNYKGCVYSRSNLCEKLHNFVNNTAKLNCAKCSGDYCNGEKNGQIGKQINILSLPLVIVVILCASLHVF